MSAAALRELLAHATRRLIEISASPRLDAEILLAAALEQPRGYLHAWPERTPTLEQAARFAAWLDRRRAGEPVAYILGRREFWSLDLEVTPDTLIPRPETELLVELALARLPKDRPVTVADLGTGSGAIALALAVEQPMARIVAIDRSPAALVVARRNAQRLEIRNVEFREGDWCAPLDNERFDLIVANPPYVAAADPRWRQGELRFEPPAALVAGDDGLSALRAIVAQAPNHLKPGGWVLLEHGYDQGEAVPALLRERGFDAVSDHRDAAGLSRTSGGCWPS
ncbi:MAG: peptide chain release factor N(5)-glutamine methyltransferase [Candidatus Contendobacter sp.]|nr:peptide chain release factor N(5)-glutamine methyltransferase [Candidatus Contendobacter sp.]MDS4057530.1 peptide chain release factor N(5)-glutamine methyltransferase [Candidatus Contendobacter sp.]